MPLALRDLQAAFAAHVFGGRSAPTSWPRSWAIRSRPRRGCASIAIMSSTASAPRWPRPFRRCRRWSGPIFSVALRVPSSVTRCRSQPVLAEYGAGFPAFIAGYDAARDAAVPGRCRPAGLGPESRLPCPARRSADGGRPFRHCRSSICRRCRSPWRPGHPGQLALSPGSHLGGLPARRLRADGRSEFSVPPISSSCAGRTMRRSSA